MARMKSAAILAIVLGLGGLGTDDLSAASLQVSPVFLEIMAPGAAATVMLRNNGTRPITTQVRIFRWVQESGEEHLVPTDDVVASPPAVELRPDQDYVVRVVRLAKRPVEGEEAYRLFIDELPEPHQHTRAVTFVVRHAIPLLFDSPDSSAPNLVWRVAQKGPAIALTVTNDGDRRFRLAAVKISGGNGKFVSFGPGLVGYVLGHSSMTFTVPAKLVLQSGAKVMVNGRSEEGAFNAPAAVQSAR